MSLNKKKHIDICNNLQKNSLYTTFHMTHPVYREECKKKRGCIPCTVLVGRNRREREQNPRKGRASTITTSNKKGRKKDRKKIEAWLKARRVLTMADDFQLLLSPSREWKMENPNAGYIYIYISICIYIYTELIYFESFSRASLHLFSPAFTVFSIFFSSWHIRYLRRDIPALWIERETHSCQLSMEISWILRIKGLHRFEEKNAKSILNGFFFF